MESLVDRKYLKDHDLLSRNTNRTSDSSNFSLEDSEFGESSFSTSGCSSEVPKKVVTREQKQVEIKRCIKELKGLLHCEKRGTVPVLQKVVTAVKNLKDSTSLPRGTLQNCKSRNLSTPRAVNSVPEYFSKLELGRDNKNEFVWQLKADKYCTIHVDDKVKSVLGFHQEIMEGRYIKDFVHPEDIGLLELSLSYVLDEFASDKAIPQEDMKPYIPEKWFFIRFRKRIGLTAGFGMQEEDQFITMQVSPSVYANCSNHVSQSKSVGYESGVNERTESASPQSMSEETTLDLLCIPVMSFYTAPDCFPKSATFHTRHDVTSCMFSKVHPNIVPLLGYLPQEFLKIPIFDLYYPDDLPHLYRIYEELVCTKGSNRISSPIRMLARNGHYVVVNTEWCGFVSPSTDRLEFITGKHEIICGPSDPDIFNGSDRNISLNRTEEQQQGIHEFKKLLLQATTGNVTNVKNDESEMKFFTDESDSSLSYHQMNYRDCIRRYLYSQLSVSHDSYSEIEPVSGLDDLSGPSSGSGTRGFYVLMAKPQSLDSSTKVLVSDHDQALEEPPAGKLHNPESVDDVQLSVEPPREETQQKDVDDTTKYSGAHSVDNVEEMHPPVNSISSTVCPLTEESLRQHTKIQERLYLIASEKRKIHRGGMNNVASKRTRSSALKSSSWGSCSGPVDQPMICDGRVSVDKPSHSKSKPIGTTDNKRQKTKENTPRFDTNEIAMQGMQDSQLPTAFRTITSVSGSEVRFPYYYQFGVSFPPQVCLGIGQNIPVDAETVSKPMHTTMIGPTPAIPPCIYGRADRNITSSSSQDDLDSSRLMDSSTTSKFPKYSGLYTSQRSSSLPDLTKPPKEVVSEPGANFQITKKTSCQQLSRDRVSLGKMPQSDLVIAQLDELLKDVKTTKNQFFVDEEADLLFFNSSTQDNKANVATEQDARRCTEAGVEYAEGETQNMKWTGSDDPSSSVQNDQSSDSLYGVGEQFVHFQQEQYDSKTKAFDNNYIQGDGSMSNSDEKFEGSENNCVNMGDDSENNSVDAGNSGEVKKSKEASPDRSDSKMSQSSSDQLSSGSSSDRHDSEKSSLFTDSFYSSSVSREFFKTQSSSDITPSDERSEDCISSFKESDGTGKECKKNSKPNCVQPENSDDKLRSVFSQLFLPLKITVYNDLGSSVSPMCQDLQMDFKCQMEYQLPPVNCTETLINDKTFLNKTAQPLLLREQFSEWMDGTLSMDMDTLLV